MSLAPEQIEEIAKYTSAVVGGGLVAKFLDFFRKKRLTNAQADRTISDAALDHIDRLVSDVERAKNDSEQFKKESEQCRQNYEELRIVVTDLKISLRSVYEYMSNHVGECPALTKKDMPSITQSLLK